MRTLKSTLTPNMTQLLFILRSADSSRFGMILFFLSALILALLELLSVGVVPAFITVLLTPETATKYFSKYVPSLGLNTLDHLSLVLRIGIALTFILILKSIFALSISLYQARAMAGYQATFSSKLLSKYLGWPYERLLTKNSSELIRNTVSVPVTIVSSVLMGLTILATEFFLVVLIAAVLLYVHPFITLVTLLILGSSVGVFFLILKNRLADLGRRSNGAAAKTMQWLNQSLGGVKEIKIVNCEKYFHDQYMHHFVEFSRSTLNAQYLSQAPRFFLEVVAVGSMVGLAVVLLMSGNRAELLPTIALFGAVSLRLIPSANRIWGAIANMRANINSAEIFERDLSENFLDENIFSSSKGWKFEESLEVKGLSYTYKEGGKPALDQIDLVIRNNTTVGIAGRSGAGKSTLLDILLGLHRASAGDVLVDGRSIWSDLPAWRASIGYVPQQIFILDDSIRRNIAMGEDDHAIDDARILDALVKANLDEFVMALPQQLDTLLGERGGRLSGGQRQRIGIARALYRNPRVLFLDEPTSALDKETEQSITETLQRLHGTITIVIIAHHAEMMKLCDCIFMLDKGRLIAAESGAELERFNIQFK